MTQLTDEAFLTTPQPDEPDTDEQATSSDPFAGFTVTTSSASTTALDSIAQSLQQLTELALKHDTAGEADDQAQQALNQLDAEYGELKNQVDQVLELIKKSTSKLANSIRDVLLPPVEVQVSEPTPVVEQPDRDASVEEWRAYARRVRNLGHSAESSIDAMNRSQIRTMLGIEHTNTDEVQ